MAELLTLVDIGDVDFDDGTAQRADTVLKRHTGMRIGAGIQHDTIVTAEETRLLHLINQLTLDVALIIVYLDIGEAFTQFRQVAVKRLRAIDARLTLAQ